MSTHRSFDRICAAAIVFAMLLSLILWGVAESGGTAKAQTPEYETRLFDTGYVHTIDIVMNDWDEFLADCENEEYADCAVVIDGEKMKNVSIRAKGNTSLSNVRSMNSQRYSFKIEFDHNQKGRTYHGLDKLCLNNLIQDNTMIKDFLSYQMMRQFGVNTPLCSFAYVRVNGEDWGLYLAVEGVEDSFLARNFGTNDGELYKPDSMSFGGGRGNGLAFNMDDFDFSAFDQSVTPDRQMPAMPAAGEGVPDFSFTSGMQPPEFPSGGFSDGKENVMAGFGSSDVKLQYIDDDPSSYPNIFDNAKTKVTEADQQRLIAALKNLSEGTDIENTVNVDEVIRYFTVHNFLRNGDSYTGAMIHNYYLYEKNGQLTMIPWDYNLAFGTFQGGNASDEINADIDMPVMGNDLSDRPMLSWIFANETYTEQYHQLMSEFLDVWFSEGQMDQLIASLHEMLLPFVEKDPTKFCTVDEFETAINTISEFVTLRAESVKGQLAGDDQTVDASHLDLSAMGTMNSAGFADGNGMPKMPEAFSGETFGTNPDTQTVQGGLQGTFTPPQASGGRGMPDGAAFAGGPPDMSGFGSSGGFAPPSFGMNGTDGTGSSSGSGAQTVNTGTNPEAADGSRANPSGNNAERSTESDQTAAQSENDPVRSALPSIRKTGEIAAADSKPVTLLLVGTLLVLLLGLLCACFYSPRKQNKRIGG